MTADENICREIVNHHLNSPAMWSVFLIQDILAMDGSLRQNNPEKERINDPADPDHQWKYRMNVTLDDLIAAKSFNHSVKAMIRLSGR